jgi:hypothetical protein
MVTKEQKAFLEAFLKQNKCEVKDRGEMRGCQNSEDLDDFIDAQKQNPTDHPVSKHRMKLFNGTELTVYAKQRAYLLALKGDDIVFFFLEDEEPSSKSADGSKAIGASGKLPYYDEKTKSWSEKKKDKDLSDLFCWVEPNRRDITCSAALQG